mmetsp:Transcript_112470/g.223508  ORF Transcript_112470/g.223508 Transcript_112470/m.223508 type:complete len:235 (+) Transcript_112470:213-917(+)|eukprot:CAMPEP_0172895586 /NCGR_PEP_ID=MMETSP1075-20121228/153404_1 /TAXON_ID=2916 /ORGANISM="Ceratium fusus, Strain PA161109" /LENGTH=234 /DNA_ID=CAMNT_0013750823 /DNA_START=171 /DNA_END=875 /DNA_ORIENTATION=+
MHVLAFQVGEIQGPQEENDEEGTTPSHEDSRTRQHQNTAEECTSEAGDGRWLSTAGTLLTRVADKERKAFQEEDKHEHDKTSNLDVGGPRPDYIIDFAYDIANRSQRPVKPQRRRVIANGRHIVANDHQTYTKQRDIDHYVQRMLLLLVHLFLAAIDLLEPRLDVPKVRGEGEEGAEALCTPLPENGHASEEQDAACKQKEEATHGHALRAAKLKLLHHSRETFEFLAMHHTTH